jgi:DNA-binding NarL/FixJ family response regulator
VSKTTRTSKADAPALISATLDRAQTAHLDEVAGVQCQTRHRAPHPREIEVLEALTEGLDTQAIASRLHISIRTQRNHMSNILTKLEVHSRLQALVLALRYGVVEIPG